MLPLLEHNASPASFLLSFEILSVFAVYWDPNADKTREGKEMVFPDLKELYLQQPNYGHSWCTIIDIHRVPNLLSSITLS